MNNMYMEIAEIVAKQSKAEKRKVGCLIVKQDRIISIGYNGTPSGWDNECEFTVAKYDQKSLSLVQTGWKTKPEVLHAETNAIAKLARSTESGEGADLYTTYSPCLDCAKLIYQSGIKRLFYKTWNGKSEGISFLKKCKVDINHVGEK